MRAASRSPLPVLVARVGVCFAAMSAVAASVLAEPSSEAWGPGVYAQVLVFALCVVPAGVVELWEERREERREERAWLRGGIAAGVSSALVLALAILQGPYMEAALHRRSLSFDQVVEVLREPRVLLLWVLASSALGLVVVMRLRRGWLGPWLVHMGLVGGVAAGLGADVVAAGWQAGFVSGFLFGLFALADILLRRFESPVESEGG